MPGRGEGRWTGQGADEGGPGSGTAGHGESESEWRTMAGRPGTHPKAGRYAARFRVGTRLLPDLVLSEDKTAEAVG